jgi:class 3 adenylate cyclase
MKQKFVFAFIHSRMSLTFVFVDTVYCKDHALVMARFARDCLSSLQIITKELEVMLGPDTADLTMRVGLHSGPGMLSVYCCRSGCCLVPAILTLHGVICSHSITVTAGVLRGERARFQLFGDTMNTARYSFCLSQ